MAHDKSDCPSPCQADDDIFYPDTTFKPERIRPDPDPLGVNIPDEKREEGRKEDPFPKKDRCSREKCNAAGKKADVSIGTAQFALIDGIFLAIKCPVKSIGGIDDEGKCTIFRNPYCETCKEECYMEPQSPSLSRLP